MKKTMLFAIALVSFFMVSCGGSIESDAQRIVDLQCKAKKLQENATAGDLSIIEQSGEIIKEVQALVAEFQEKYKSKEDEEKFKVALEKAMKNSDCN
ncbi:MAG: hypothetical protein AAF617_04715 [Bacteroidota bacterium]